MNKQRFFYLQRKLSALLFAFIILFTATSCSFQKSNDNSAQNPSGSIENQTNSAADNAEFAEFVSDLFCETVSSDTLTLHAFINNPSTYGLEDYEVTLGRYDLNNLDNTTDITDSLNTLNSFERSSLSAKQQITYDQLKYYLNTQLEYSDLYLYNSALSTTIGIQVQLPIIFAEYSFSKKQDIDDYILLIEDVDEYMANLIEYEKLRAAQGLFMEDQLADLIIAQCQTFIDTASDGYLITTFNDRIDAFEGLTAEERSAYKESNAVAVSEHMVKGYSTLKEGLTALKGSNQYAGGLCNYPDGKQYFEYVLKNELGWNRTVEQLDSLIDTYLGTYMLQMQKLLSVDNTLTDKFSTFSFSITDPTGILEDLKTRITDDYPEIPDVNYEVKYIDKALQDYASPAMYFLPQLDNLSMNSIYINPAQTTGNDLYPTLAHEGYPGHLYQTQYFAATNPDLIRHLIAPGGYTEGWATYVETASYSYAPSEDSSLKELMMYNYATILCLYGKIDIGVNYNGWTSTDVFNYIQSYGFNDQAVADEMYISMVSEPGNYSQYVLGFLAFNELKQQAQTACGDSFVLKDFHKYILDFGPVPFNLLENGLQAWAEKEKFK